MITGEKMTQIIYVETPDIQMEKRVTKAPMHTMHYHQTLEIFYVIKGEREYFVENSFYKLTEGDLILIPSGRIHRTEGKAASRFLVSFSGEFLREYLSEALINTLVLDKTVVFRPNIDEKENLSRLFNSFFSEYTRLGLTEEGRAVFAGYLFKILFTLSRGENTYSSEDYKDRRIEGIVKYINENYASIANIEEISEHFYISKYHLCRLFNRELGVGLVTYLNNIRIRSAALLLDEGKMSITDIATSCGFNSSSYFCKVFKSEKGVSPTEYKRRKRAQTDRV